MVINRVEVKNHFIFKDEIFINFCEGVNIFIGGNATGKTTLINSMYKPIRDLMNSPDDLKRYIEVDKVLFPGQSGFMKNDDLRFIFKGNGYIHGVYIPEKDILEHARGLLTFIEQKTTGFSQIYKDILVTAQDVPTNNQTETQKYICNKIKTIIGGVVHRDEISGEFYTLKQDGSRIPFYNEASGYKKLGLLGLLVNCGQLAPGSVLFWDEPENSLNPEIIPEFVDTLLELSKSGVQMFLATHDYNLARYFDVRKYKSIPVMFHNLTKAKEGGIICDSSPEYLKINHNLLEAAGEKLFNAVVNDAMGVIKNE